MRAIISGVMTAFRYQQIKDNKVGQLDLLQAGDNRFASKVVSLYIVNGAYTRLALETLEKYRDPLITLLVWIDDSGRETTIEVLEILNLTAEELLPDDNGNGGSDDAVGN